MKNEIMYHGTPLNELSKEQLIKAVIEQHTKFNEKLEGQKILIALLKHRVADYKTKLRGIRK